LNSRVTGSLSFYHRSAHRPAIVETTLYLKSRLAEDRLRRLQTKRRESIMPVRTICARYRQPLRLTRPIGLLLLACVSLSAKADDAQDCRAAGGSLLVGEVVSPPRFQHGSFRKGVELSHTHLKLKGDTDGQTYDVAIDNVFASGYQKNAKTVPAPLNTISVGDKLELCGIPFKGGIHWVHNNCGDTSTSTDPNGWIKEVQANGTVGPNLESGETYCYLWPRQ
jgi:hypothetical protein